MSTTDALLAGSTGLIGRELAAAWAGPGTLHRLVRRPMPIATATAAAAATRQRVQVVDFAALPPLPAATSAFCCLGTTIAVAGSQAAFRAVDFDAVLAFAVAAKAAGVRRFGVVSSLGANPGARSFYSRVKGEMEGALGALGFESLVIARPSLLAGDRASLNQPMRLGERLGLAVMGPLGGLIPLAWRPIPAAVVARALLRAVAEGQPGVRVIESAALQRLGR